MAASGRQVSGASSRGGGSGCALRIPLAFDDFQSGFNGFELRDARFGPLRTRAFEMQLPGEPPARSREHQCDAADDRRFHGDPSLFFSGSLQPDQTSVTAPQFRSLEWETEGGLKVLLAVGGLTAMNGCHPGARLVHSRRRGQAMRGDGQTCT